MNFLWRENPVTYTCLGRKGRGPQIIGHFTGFFKNGGITNFPDLPDVMVISADDDCSLDFARGNRLVEALRYGNPAHLVRVQNPGL